MTQLRDISHSLPMQLLQARETAMGYFRPMLRRHGMTEQQWRVIRVLAAAGPLDISELAKRSMLLAPSLSRILQFLEREQLVKRSTDKQDQRRSLISLTARGQRKYAAIGPDSEALYRHIENAFGRDKLDELNKLLNDLNTSIGQEG